MGMERFSPPKKKLIKTPLKLDSYLPKFLLLFASMIALQK